MARGSFLIAALLAFGSACSGLGSFEVYCRNSGECACVDGDCCAFEGKSCEDLGCCDGAACVGGVCGTPVRFELTPSTLDFGWVRSFPSPAKSVTVTNISSRSAAVDATVDNGYEQVASDCPALLAPGASCSIQVRVIGPWILAELLGSLQVENARPRSVTLRSVTGRLVVVSVEGPMSVSSDPAGISCPGQCKAVFPLDVPVSLIPSEVPYGYWMNSMTLWCDPATGACPVSISLTEFSFAARMNLAVRCFGPGKLWLGNEPLCTTTDTPWSDGGKAMVGTAVIEARSSTGGPVEWMYDCEGVTGNVCTLEVNGPTTVTAVFK